MTAALLAKLESASEGSRELDFWIAYELGLMAGIVPVRPANVREGHGEVCLLDASGKSLGWVGYHVSSPVTTSIDAALALAERCGWRLYSLDASIVGVPSVMLQSVDDRPGTDPETGAYMIGKDFSRGSSKTPALAICAALLRASAAEGAGHG